MSDYLDHLVEKSLNSTAAVRPRLASRFEAQEMGIGTLSLVSPGAPGAAAEQQIQEPRTEAQSALSLLGAPAPEPHAGVRPGTHTSEPAAPLPARTGSSEAPAAGSVHPSTARAERPVPVPEEGALSAQPTFLTPARQPASSPATPTALEPEEERLRAPALRPAIRRRDRGGTSLSRSPSPAEPAQPGSSQGRDADRGTLGVVPLPPVTAQAKPEPEQAPAPSTPTVRVTIGRIELRSSAAPPPRRARPAPARRGPALSLDAYLKQRNGG